MTDVAYAEQALLGCVISSPRAAESVLPSTKADDFELITHATIFAALCDMFEEGVHIDALTLGSRMQAAGDLKRVGGSAYLHTLVATPPSIEAWRSYQTIVQTQSARRQVRTALTRIEHQLNTAESADAVMSLLSDQTMSVLSKHEDHHEYKTTLAEAMLEAIARADMPLDPKDAPLLTGYQALDTLITGFRPGQFIVLGGRPGSGKSTVAFDIARHAALRLARPVLFYSLEMAADEMADRAVAAELEVNLTSLRTRTLSSSDWQMASTLATSALANAGQMTVLTPPRLDIATLRADLRRARHSGGVGLVVVDYLQLMSTTTRSENRQLEVAALSRSLKIAAREFGTPILAASQLNRASEARHDKRPVLSDLRESGALEQDPDIVMLVHQPEAAETGVPAILELIVAKHRNGPTGTVELVADLSRSRVLNF